MPELPGETHVVVKHAPANAEARPETLVEEITPTSGFFRRSNFDWPELSSERHQIVVDGAVVRPLLLSLAELRDLPWRRFTATMECAGNDRLGMAPLPAGELWQGGAVSTAEWAGVPLAAVLERAGVQPEVLEILLEGADSGTPADAPGGARFARSLPLGKAFDPDTLLALEMNGEPLPRAHGGPLRLVVPGWYGMASVKWVGRITALTEPFAGYFQRDRYVYRFPGEPAEPPVTEMEVKSIITTPLAGEVVPLGRCTVRGWAWSGRGAIERVEVAIGGGDVWQPAHLHAPASPHAWCGWEYDWEVAEAGRQVLRSRAWDAAGNVQPAAARWNELGYANNGIRQIVLTAR